jgi:murein DD-endopeptidase MepM/ murein hydrolase activator NlpD
MKILLTALFLQHTLFTTITCCPQPACLNTQVNDSPELALRQQIRQLPGSAVLRLFPRILTSVPPIAFTIPCIPPVNTWQHNRLSSGFGWRRHPVLGRYRHHQGIDIAGPQQYVRAAASGWVVRTGYDSGLGHYVIIDHKNSYQTLYGHLAVILTKVGQRVTIGDCIGVLGRSGRVTGLHLHYAVKKNGEYVNPAPYLTLGLQLLKQQHMQASNTNPDRRNNE